jgi:hypothetical protein
MSSTLEREAYTRIKILFSQSIIKKCISMDIYPTAMYNKIQYLQLISEPSFDQMGLIILIAYKIY